jgi:hypothetical protein
MPTGDAHAEVGEVSPKGSGEGQLDHDLVHADQRPLIESLDAGVDDSAAAPPEIDGPDCQWDSAGVGFVDYSLTRIA